MDINSLKAAIQWFIAYMRSKGIDLAEVGDIQGAKGSIAGICSGKGKRFYVMYKRDWLHSFQYLFEKPGTGWGQTVNMRIMKHAAGWQKDTGNKAELVSVMPTKAYSIDATTMYDYVTSNTTIRIPSTEIGEEGSCPSRMWTAI